MLHKVACNDAASPLGDPRVSKTHGKVNFGMFVHSYLLLIGWRYAKNYSKVMMVFSKLTNLTIFQ
jgi:hypothetical protein